MFIKSRTALHYITDAYNSFQSLRLGLKLTLPFKFSFFFPHFFLLLGIYGTSIWWEKFPRKPLGSEFFNEEVQVSLRRRRSKPSVYSVYSGLYKGFRRVRGPAATQASSGK